MASRGPDADLLEAAKAGDTARVTALLEKGASVDARDEKGRCPLMYAIIDGHLATVEALVAAGADLNLQSLNGATALHWAVLYNAAVGILVAAGADMNIKSEDGNTPLMAAVQCGLTAVVRSLVAFGADMNIQTWDGRTALHFAVASGDTAIMEMLVEAGANMSIGTEDGTTPLMAAALEGSTVAVQSLLGAGADLDIQDNNGCTALFWALHKSKFEATEVLIKAGAGLSQQVKITGWTALFVAAKAGHLPSVRLLLEGGADPTHKGKDRMTALDVAEKYNHQTIVKELKDFITRHPVVIPFKHLEIKDTVGEGAFGAVFKGYWTSSDGGRQLVAMKQLSKVIQKEITILASISHPNIIKLYGTSENKPYTYLVTDYAENGSLFDFIKNSKRPDQKKTLPWAKQVAEGMLYLHHHGIIHRDLKSSNVVLTSEWVAKICDLGTARELDHTTMVTSAGTVAWMAPEIVKEEPASSKCDIYSYAIVLWELATFQVPFEKLPRFDIMTKVANGERPAIPSSCDQFFSALIQRCWAHNYEERPDFDEILRSFS